MKDPRDIIKRPIITEVTTEMMADKKYVFDVDVRATKVDIRIAIEKIFSTDKNPIKVVSVNTINVKKKPARYGRYTGFTARRKKAIVQLSEDSKPLEFFEGV